MPGRRAGRLAGVACAAVASGAVFVAAPAALGADHPGHGGGSTSAAAATFVPGRTAIVDLALVGGVKAGPAEERQAAAASSVIAYARRQLGTPYVWGGTGPHGFDCSGLIQRAFAVVGVRLPRGSIAQSHAGSRISRTQLIPGDLIFSNNYNHVQLYIGDGKVVEAARPGTNVRISRMLPAWMINAYVRVALAR